MARTLSAKELRGSLPDVVARVKKGERFTLIYRSQPVLELVPLGVSDAPMGTRLEDDPLYRAPALGRSTDGLHSEDHDHVLYGAPRRSKPRPARRRTAR